MRPPATFVDYVYTLKITQLFFFSTCSLRISP